MPFLTSKHSLEYCLSYAERAHQSGFPALVVLGGDKSVGHAAIGRACLAAAAAASRARPHAHARRMGEPARGCRAAGRLPERAELPRGVLSDAGRQPPRRRPVERFLDGRRAARTDAAGRLRRVLLPQREPEDAGRAEELSAGAGRRAHARVRARARPPRRSARGRSGRCSTPARAISTSATCRSTRAGSSRVHPRARGNRAAGQSKDR